MNAPVFATFTGTEYLWFGAIPIAQISTNPSVPIRYTFTDHLGTPVLQTDPDAEIAWQADYDPYGQIFGYRTGSDTDPQVLRLPGQESDDYTAGRSGTYYNIFRWYRAGWGRYAQADPVGLQAGTNLFTYVHGNPISLRDPLGLFCTSDFVKNYLSGSGLAISLASVGLQSTFVNSPSVQGGMSAERAGMMLTAAKKAKELCSNCDSGVKSGTFTSSGSDYVNPYLDGTPCVGWPIGSTMLNVTSTCTYKANCSSKTFSATCKSQWKLKDMFSNPFSQGEPGGNPGKSNDLLGTPYLILAGWTDTYYGGGDL